MSEIQENNKRDHHASDEAELSRLEGFEASPHIHETETTSTSPKRFGPWAITLAVVAAIVVVSLVLIAIKRGGSEKTEVDVKAETETSDQGEPKELHLTPEILAAAGIESESITQRPAIALVTVAGTVEANPQTTQQVTTLVGGRVENIYVSIGNRVSAGQVVATIRSTEIAEMVGKWHEAMTQLELAKKNLDRVRRAENRAAVLASKAKLDEAQATLNRTKRLIELGAGAGKDLISADANYQTAKADYDYQRNISLNKEIAEAEAALATATVDADHQRLSLQALGVDPAGHERQNIALVSLRSPVSGIVTERPLASGAGVQAGTSLMTISNISSVWVIANVPENQMSLLRVGTPAEIRVAALGDRLINGHVAYIDPQLAEETRTGKVRIEVPNRGEALKAGMFVQVGFQAGTGAATGEELVVPSTAVQRLGDRTIVFIPKEGENGVFEVRDVEIGSLIEGYHRVVNGVALGDRVVTKGSFTLKTQLQKGELGEE